MKIMVFVLTVCLTASINCGTILQHPQGELIVGSIYNNKQEHEDDVRSLLKRIEAKL